MKIHGVLQLFGSICSLWTRCRAYTNEKITALLRYSEKNKYNIRNYLGEEEQNRKHHQPTLKYFPALRLKNFV